MMWTAIIGSSALAALISGIFNLIANKNKFNKALQLLLLGEIKRLAVECLNQGYIDAESLKLIEELYATYKSMGGNGYADTLMARVRALPIKE